MKSLSFKYQGIFFIMAIFSLSLFPACNSDDDDETGGDENGDVEVWEPYQVKANTEYAYDFERSVNDEVVASGDFNIMIGDPEVEISGTIDGQQLSFSCNNSTDVTENFESAITMTQASFLYQSSWPNAFAGEEIEVGNNWSYSANGQTFSFDVTGTDSYAGIDGYVLEVIYDDGNEVDQSWTACINKDVPLALMMRVVDGDEEYYFKLTNYEE